MNAEEFFTQTYPQVGAEFGRFTAELQERFGVRFELAKGGKFFRPSLTLLVAQACGGQVTDLTLKLAAVPEVIHQVSLWHDDVVDADPLRRGAPALHQQVGTAVAVLFGDVSLLEMVRRAMVLGPRILPLAVAAAEALLKGVLREVTVKGLQTPEMYEELALAKNAALFALACQFGAISAQAPPALEEAARDFGKQVGLIHQLADDAVDVRKSLRTGQPHGDLKERRTSYPLLLLARTNRALEAQVHEWSFGKRDWTDVVGPLQAAAPALEALDRRFDQLGAQARAQASLMPVEPYRSVLLEVPGLIRDRMEAELDGGA